MPLNIPSNNLIPAIIKEEDEAHFAQRFLSSFP